MTLAELLRAADHENWWDDGVQVFCERGGELRPLTGIRGGVVPVSGRRIVILTTSEERK